MAKKDQTSRPKRQHYVPRMHLRHFAGTAPANMVWTFDNQTARWRPSTVDNTAVQTNFYSFETADGLNDELEELLGKIEASAAPGYEVLLSGGELSGQLKADFAMFLATLHLRTPAMVNAVAAGKAEMMDLHLDMLTSTRESFDATAARYKAETGKSLGDFNRMRAFVKDKSRYTLAVRQKIGLSIIGAADQIAPLLYARNWCVCHAVEGFFVTSDHPVFRWVPEEKHHRFYGDGGFKNIKAEITFPLSPDKLLLMAGPDLTATAVPFGSSDVALANDMRAFAADRYIFSPRPDKAAAAMAVKHRDEHHHFGLSSSEGRQKPEVRVVRRIEERGGE